MSDRNVAPELRIEDLREKLRSSNGPRYWRSLEELAATPEFGEMLQREFAQMLPVEGTSLSRRRFVQLMGASMALAGISGCSIQPEEDILPYTKQPEEIIPGKPLYFATAMCMGGYSRGVLVESHMGRPTKIEGNPDHPASLGATTLFEQASILTLYDPDRSRAPSYLGAIRSWEPMQAELSSAVAAQQALQGEGLRLLLPTSTSPTLAAQLRRLRQTFPRAEVVFYDPVGSEAARRGARDAFGRWTEVVHDVGAADVILSIDCDLLAEGPGAVRHARDFSTRRRAPQGGTAMNRLYAVESSPTSTGTIADHRLSLAPHRVEAFVRALAAELEVPGAQAQPESELAAPLQSIAQDLRAHRGRSLIVAGPSAAPEVHILVHAMNEALGNLGRTVRLGEPLEVEPGDRHLALRRLSEDMHAGKVDLLLIAGVNPVFELPPELDFSAALEKVRLRVHAGLYRDETAEYCQWHVPLSHYLEAWSDARAFDGTASIVQPLIAPLYNSRSIHELLELILGGDAVSGRELVRSTWRERSGAIDFDRNWRRWVHDGWIPGTSIEHRSLAIDPSGVRAAALSLDSRHAERSGLSVALRPDPTIWDGSFANNGWLQECPKPHTRITWDNAALLSPATAERLSVRSEDKVRVTVDGQSLELAAWVLPAHADDTVTVHLGYGRRRAGKVGRGTGFNAYPLRTLDQMWTRPGATLEKIGGRYRLASTQIHHNMEGRHLVRHATIDEYRQHPDFVHALGHAEAAEISIMPGFEYEGHRWGMVVDLGSCIGCNACLVACHAENNISIVGKEEVLNGREMHWIRIDRYFEGELDQPATLHQPVMCQHCEQAPCEVVCPVSATVHTHEGLNTMAYNRCVGTRYCANNCPYKVRRFNFYQYADQEHETLALQRNPNVTVRSRGVMEKCSYCVQRINRARIEATVRDLPISQLGLQSACQQACPTRAISFGDLNDEQSEVSQLRASELNYGILEELGTRPRTTYLARLSNPNPVLKRS
jgi:molybdopterin-containing oxidoreductase family iron-sulfur binding subunit